MLPASLVIVVDCLHCLNNLVFFLIGILVIQHRVNLHNHIHPPFAGAAHGGIQNIEEHLPGFQRIQMNTLSGLILIQRPALQQVHYKIPLGIQVDRELDIHRIAVHLFQRFQQLLHQAGKALGFQQLLTADEPHFPESSDFPQP